MRKRALGLILGLGVLAAACGSGGQAATLSTAVTTQDGNHHGDVSAVPADQIPGAELSSGPFVWLDTAPIGYEQIGGDAMLARHDDGTTVTLHMDGLAPNKQFIAHVHAGTCDEYGGPHYKFDLSGGDMPPNEIHLMFESGDTGHGFMTAESSHVAGPTALSVVVHPAASMAAKAACADLA